MLRKEQEQILNMVNWVVRAQSNKVEVAFVKTFEEWSESIDTLPIVLNARAAAIEALGEEQGRQAISGQTDRLKSSYGYPAPGGQLGAWLKTHPKPVRANTPAQEEWENSVHRLLILALSQSTQKWDKIGPSVMLLSSDLAACDSQEEVNRVVVKFCGSIES